MHLMHLNFTFNAHLVEYLSILFTINLARLSTIISILQSWKLRLREVR